MAVNLLLHLGDDMLNFLYVLTSILKWLIFMVLLFQHLQVIYLIPTILIITDTNIHHMQPCHFNFNFSVFLSSKEYIKVHYPAINKNFYSWHNYKISIILHIQNFHYMAIHKLFSHIKFSLFSHIKFSIILPYKISIIQPYKIFIIQPYKICHYSAIHKFSLSGNIKIF